MRGMQDMPRNALPHELSVRRAHERAQPQNEAVLP